MPRGMFKSRSLRRIFVKTPGGKVHMHYRERKPKQAHCASCRKPLAGVPRENPGKMGKIAKSSRRPERIYGGVLCSRCSRATLQAQVRVASGNTASNLPDQEVSP